jgi:putative phosphoribosyl transferase
MFRNRIDAGHQLARVLREHLAPARSGEPPVILGLPRGGVPVAAQVAAELDAPLDVIVVRKLGVPFQPELAMGAIGEDGVRVLNPEVLTAARVATDDLAAVEADERRELERRARRFRAGRPRLPITGRDVVIVDDGIATGSTARAACAVARAHGADQVTLAVPVAPSDWTARLGDTADDYVAVATPDQFWAVGQFYDDFRQTSDEEVVRYLQAAATTATPSPGAAGAAGGDVDDPPIVDADVTLRVDGSAGPVEVRGHLTVPEAARGVVLFAHGSGSSRHSPRNRFVAGLLNDAGLATLLFDLLTADEERDRSNVFDVALLAGRLVDATDWVRRQPRLADLPIGYFGASTGAAAALVAAARPGADVAAVVSRGGRPDLAGPALPAVEIPTLLIVGGEDHVVLGLNRDARARLGGPSALTIIPGATHLFEEPGTLRAAADAARDWLLEHLARAAVDG